MLKSKLTTTLCASLLAASMLTACGSTPAAQESTSAVSTASVASVETTQTEVKEVTLTAMTNLQGEQATILEAMLKGSSADVSGVTIDFSALAGKDYENIMKVKMASSDMPDLFSTHGWAKIRYGKFLADLKDRAWAKNIATTFKPIISDDTGKVFVLAFDQDVAGPVYNPNILKQYGIEVPKTYEEFVNACETIKTKSNGSITPITCSSEGWEEAEFFEYIGQSVFTAPKTNDGAALIDGSFDWTKWEQLAKAWQELYTKGYINKDMLTAKYDDNVKAYAAGKVAFGFYGPYFVEEARKTNPNVAGDLMPIPAWDANGQQSFAGGEKDTIGAWKDSDNLETALKVIDYCAKPENVEKMAASTKLPTGLTDSKMNAGDFQAAYEKYADLPTVSYLDRSYLPNGMWDVMCKNAQSLVAGKMTPKQSAEDMKKEYDRLMKAAQ